ncbi:MAG TPA: SIMPL domain-containing protein, partial [Pyrinomonadaceae bacterium]|nr:SIMPL domain-containing protein [Pyrinomonadaceae bacterium]
GLVVFAAALYLYRPAPSNNYTRVTVVGESQTEVPPDTAVVSFSVVTQNANAVTAQQENARKIEAVLKALENTTNGAKQEVKTSNYSLSPEQDYSGSGMPKIIGYEARNTVTVTTDNLNQVGALIDAATKAGANSVEGISFVLRDDSSKRGDALGTATKQAMTKAESIAASLGGKIVRVVETVEGGATPTPVIYQNSTAAANSNATFAKPEFRTQIQAGSINVRGQVTLVVEIDARK